ncbi:MAG: ABC transporter substrate-binding protein [Deltaproteobacteria bacterium]|nr:ABC transporter substrate-binding protein [Deltaproteobacteria bacterium]
MLRRFLDFLRSAGWLLVVASSALQCAIAPADGQETKSKIRISNSAMSVTSLPLLAAREWKLFHERGLDPEIILMSPAITVPAMVSGEVDYFAGVGPGVASASLSGLPFRAVWVSADKVSHSLVAHPKFKTLQDLKGKKIGVTGSLGATNHMSLVIALEKLGIAPKEFNILALPPQEMLRSLESGFIDAASLNPPSLFMAQKKGFPSVLDIGSLVEMPGGGLTVLEKDIKNKPDEVKRVIRAMQGGKEAMRKSKEKSVELMRRLLKMDPESAGATFEVFLKTLSADGVPTRTGMDNLVKSIQAQGRFTDKKPLFSDLADDRLAKEVAKELGYKVQ